DLTRHARAYRELSLLLERSPGREAYPGDIFYIHSRLLERSTHMRPEYGNGSITALPVIETEAQNLAAYIPTNLISITDGQIYLSPDLFAKGFLPAVDVGKSVSRVGGKAQKAGFRDLVGQLHLSYSQFEELETFSRFATRLDEETTKNLERGKRLRELMRQDRFQGYRDFEQIIIMLALTEGLLDHIKVKEIGEAEEMIRAQATVQLGELCREISKGRILTEKDKEKICHFIKDIFGLGQESQPPAVKA
ncbi:MAG: F0F1 ATP synthase subunit alpha, partial [Thermodesulfobacteriota bacterium]|nr:F0F1 ATP synthase subunit alpha [Thermodesulfobacteriota bacterium]